MQNHINKLSLRQLSLFAKCKILNSLILTKTTFLSNVFPIPEKKITEIYKNIFKYLWQNKKQEPIARKTLLLQKEKGGLNIKEPEAHNIAMRIKHLLSLKQNEEQPSWTYRATYWLAKDICNYGKEFHSLKQNNRAKTTH